MDEQQHQSLSKTLAWSLTISIHHIRTDDRKFIAKFRRNVEAKDYINHSAAAAFHISHFVA